MNEEKMLLKNVIFWLIIGFAIGSVIYVVMHYIINFDIGFWMLTLTFSGYMGYFVGFVCGYIRICRK